MGRGEAETIWYSLDLPLAELENGCQKPLAFICFLCAGYLAPQI